jgi:hypothetical protein
MQVPLRPLQNLTGSIDATIREAYSRLSEPQKKQISEVVFENDHKIAEQWFRFANISGYSKPKNACRRPAGTGASFDKAFLSTESKHHRRLREDVLRVFFSAVYPNWISWTRQQCCNASKTTYQGILQLALDDLSSPFNGQPYCALYKAFAPTSLELTCPTAHEAPSIEAERFPENIGGSQHPASSPMPAQEHEQEWQVNLLAYESALSALKESVRALERVAPVDKSHLSELLTVLDAKGSALREQLGALSSEVGRAPVVIESVKEFQAQLADLSDLMKEKVSTEPLREKIRILLEALMSITRVRTKRESRRVEIQAARESAIEELQKARVRQMPPLLPGHSTGVAWIEESFELNDSAWNERLDILRDAELPSLAEFLERTEEWSRLEFATKVVGEVSFIADQPKEPSVVGGPVQAPPTSPQAVIQTSALEQCQPKSEEKRAEECVIPLLDSPADAVEPAVIVELPVLSADTPVQVQENLAKVRPAEASQVEDFRIPELSPTSEKRAISDEPPIAQAEDSCTELYAEWLRLDDNEQTRLLIPDYCEACKAQTAISDIPIELWNLLAVQPYLRDSDSEEAELARGWLRKVTEMQWSPQVAHHAEIAWAAISVPSFVGMGSETSAILPLLSQGKPMPELNDIIRHMSLFITSVPHCSIERIRNGTTHDLWKRRLDELKRDLVASCNLAKDQKTSYQKATLIWHELNGPNGRLRLLANSAQSIQDRAMRGTILKEICLLEERSSRARLIDQTSQQLQTFKAVYIDGIAAQQLHNWMSAFGDKVRMLLAHVEAEPKADHFVNEQLKNFSQNTLPKISRLAHLPNEEAADGMPRIVARLLARSAKLVEGLFSGQGDAPLLRPGFLEARHLSRLRIPGLKVSASTKLIVRPELGARGTLIQSQRFQSPSAAIMRLAQGGDISNARKLLPLMEASEISSYNSSIDAQQEQLRSSARKDQKKTKRDVITSRTLSIISDADAQNFLTQLESVCNVIENSDDYEDAIAKIRDIQSRLKERMQDEAAQVRAEIAKTPRLDEELRARINELLDNGDIATAREYLTRLGNGHELPKALTERPDLPFARQQVDGINKAFTAGGGFDGFVTSFRNKSRFAGTEFPAFETEDQQVVLQWLENWRRLKSGSRHREIIQNWLQGLGFEVRQIQGSEEYLVDVIPIADRDLCAIPAFGSQSEGRYQIQVIERKPEPQQLIQRLKNCFTGRAIILLVPHSLSWSFRMEFVRLCREKRYRALLVDDCNMVALAYHATGRMRQFFLGTLPYTWADPYTPTSTNVPPEIFFGRVDALHALLDLEKQRCFVYGGRQLGKTALLREVARRFINTSEQRYAIWIDIQASMEFGRESEPSEIWIKLESKLEKELPGFGAKLRESKNTQGNPRVAAALVAWLEESPNRRLLLLLDEGDAFLDRDAISDFAETRRLKNLMDITKRHIKVVFAGLHNVQRSTRQPNHPLAHLGEAINIGAFSENGEWMEAYSLVVVPLAALGFRFQTVDLPSRVLTACNFYPGLIQQFGHRLLERMRGSRLEDPPYRIDEEDVDAILREEEFRKFMTERFNLTLQLDPRYFYLAYTFAYLFHTDPEMAARGLTEDELKAQASSFKPQVFGSLTRDEFNTLLLEMKGLGIFHQDEISKQFRLRNTNVLLLLGSMEDVEKGLLEELPDVRLDFTMATNRGPVVGSQLGRNRRRWLVRPDENRLMERKNLVTFIGAAPAAESASLSESLRATASSNESRYHSLSVSKPDLLVARLRELAAGNADEGVNLVHVLPTTPSVGLEWLYAATQFSQRVSKSKFFSLVFQLPIEFSWSNGAQFLSSSKDVRQLYARRWDKSFVAPWLQQPNQPISMRNLDQLMDLTDGWPRYLHYFADSYAECSSWDQAFSKTEGVIRDLIKSPGSHHSFVGSNKTGDAVWQFLRDISNRGQNAFTWDDIDAASELFGHPKDLLRHWVNQALRFDLVTQGSDSFRCTSLVARILGES